MDSGSRIVGHSEVIISSETAPLLPASFRHTLYRAFAVIRRENELIFREPAQKPNLI